MATAGSGGGVRIGLGKTVDSPLRVWYKRGTNLDA